MVCNIKKILKELGNNKNNIISIYEKTENRYRIEIIHHKENKIYYYYPQSRLFMDISGEIEFGDDENRQIMNTIFSSCLNFSKLSIISDKVEVFGGRRKKKSNYKNRSRSYSRSLKKHSKKKTQHF